MPSTGRRGVHQWTEPKPVLSLQVSAQSTGELQLNALAAVTLQTVTDVTALGHNVSRAELAFGASGGLFGTVCHHRDNGVVGQGNPVFLSSHVILFSLSVELCDATGLIAPLGNWGPTEKEVQTLSESDSLNALVLCRM